MRLCILSVVPCCLCVPAARSSRHERGAGADWEWGWIRGAGVGRCVGVGVGVGVVGVWCGVVWCGVVACCCLWIGTGTAAVGHGHSGSAI
jgi:hypothetical protein